LHGFDGVFMGKHPTVANIVRLDSDVMKFFPDAKSVNEALRTLINLMNNGQNPLKLSS